MTYTREGWVRPTWDAQAGDRITVDTSGGGLKVHAAPGNHGQPLSLIFYTPPTQTGVRPGVYPHPRWIRDLERGPGDAAMEVVLDGHNPEELSGRFEVREFEQVGGVVTRAWILFETRRRRPHALGRGAHRGAGRCRAAQRAHDPALRRGRPR